MNFFALAPLLATVVCLLLGIFVFTRNPKSELNRTFLLFASSLVIWNGGTFFMFVVDSHEQALRLARFLHIGVIFSPYSFLHIALLILKVRIRRYYYLAYLLPIGFVITNLLGTFIQDVRHVGYSWYGVGGPAFHVFMLFYFSIVGLFAFVAFHKKRHANDFDIKKIHYLLTAKSILLLFGIHDSLPVYGVDTYPFTNLTVYPLFTFGATIYCLLVGYSVLQHQILNIHTSLSGVVATLVRIFILFLSYFIVIIIISVAFSEYFNYFSLFSALIAFLVVITLGSIFFPKLIAHGEDAIEKRILGDKFEYQDQVRSFISEIPFYPDEKTLYRDLHNILTGTFGFNSYYLFVFDKKANTYALYQSSSIPVGENRDRTIGDDSFLISHFSKILNSETELGKKSDILNIENLDQSMKTEIADLDASIGFPLRSGRDLVGVLLIGKKTAGRPITSLDVDLCHSVTINLAFYILQSILKREVAEAQEIELLGNLSKGLAHDLNNLITPISTYFQINESSADESNSMRSISSIARRNLAAMQSYISESLFFSANQEPKIRRFSVSELLSNIEGMQSSILYERGITFTIKCPDGLEMEGDDVLIQRLIVNLVRNAADACGNGSVIEVKASEGNYRSWKSKWIRLLVSDSGAGIPDAQLKKVFNPYFTTKDFGDDTRGAGLGLSICRRIADLHHGLIHISSTFGKGTEVTVDLPQTQSHFKKGSPSATEEREDRTD